MAHDELLDLVDQNDVVIGREKRSVVYAQGLFNFRAINAFIKNSKGELWIPRRTAHKKIFPLGLDFSVGGHVESGESYQEAFKRETWEEIKLDLEQVPYRLLGKLTPHEHGVAVFMNVYEIKSEATPDYNKDDFVESFWIKPEDLLKKIAEGEKAKGDLPKLVKIFYMS